MKWHIRQLVIRCTYGVATVTLFFALLFAREGWDRSNGVPGQYLRFNPHEIALPESAELLLKFGLWASVGVMVGYYLLRELIQWFGSLQIPTLKPTPKPWVWG